MVRHLDLDRPGTMTTSECASAAIEAGLDREAVARLTETYEEVRYGGRPVTDQREEAAEQSRDRLDVGGGALMALTRKAPAGVGLALLAVGILAVLSPAVAGLIPIGAALALAGNDYVRRGRPRCARTRRRRRSPRLADDDGRLPRRRRRRSRGRTPLRRVATSTTRSTRCRSCG